jgi:aminopeptidase YwaD
MQVLTILRKVFQQSYFGKIMWHTIKIYLSSYLCCMKKKWSIAALFFLISVSFCNAQQISKAEKNQIKNIKKNISYLADDKLEGRRTGSKGEQLAYEYIIKNLKAAGINPLDKNGNYLQSFSVNEGKEIKNGTSLKINLIDYPLNKTFIPLAFSGQTYNTTFSRGVCASYNLNEMLDANKTNPHYDLYNDLYKIAKAEEEKGKSAVYFLASPGTNHSIKFDEKDKLTNLNIPVAIIETTNTDLLKDMPTVECEIMIAKKIKTGHNVVSFINNNAANTIVLGAHYDHLGYGEDHNSLYTGNSPMIHNGADDNASGTAALLELGKWLKKSTLKNYNYILVNFSGEELGLYGSKYFTDNAGINLSTINYMINMDMVGRLNDSTHGITIGGYGTSPTWGNIIKKENEYFKINIDSSGTGPSDNTSFYKKDIPVLFFFTGSHKDYHKPSDDADKINYVGVTKIINYIKNLITETNNLPKLAFTKTREVSMGKSSFKVSLGIMPDYTYSGSGVMVDGVSENKPAQKAGIKVGDVLLQLGENKFTDVQSYMGALNKFEKGQTTTIKIQRGKEEIALPITF